MKKHEKAFFVTIDVEEDLGTASKTKTFEGVTDGLSIFLDIQDELDIRATLFFTGEVARMFPDVLRKVKGKDEIGCHGLYHEPVTGEKEVTLRRDIRQCIRMVQKIANRRIFGFRAPDFMIDISIIKLLEQLGFIYDSSVLSAYPRIKSYRGFQGNAPRLPYHPSRSDYKREGNCKILEMPISSIPLINFPWSGTWVRTFGERIYKSTILLQKPQYILLALHSWDFIDLKGKTPLSRNSGEAFQEILKQLLTFCRRQGYHFLTLIEGKKLYD